MTTRVARPALDDRGASPAAKGSNIRRDVQGLRALAVLAVIADHLFRWPSGGFVGVDIFFVLSGYLITGLLLREHARTGTISFSSFYVRRFKRIIPVAVLVLYLTAVASLVLLGGERLAATLKDCVFALFFAANIRFAQQGTDYFQQGLQPSPVQHFWSLAVEEQYYLVWPWVMLGILALGARRWAWEAREHRRAVLVLVIVLVVGSLTWALAQTQQQPTDAYFSTPARAWELGVGALVAVAAPSLERRSLLARRVVSWAGLAAILLALLVVPQGPGFPAPWALLPVLATAAVIVAGEGGQESHPWPLTMRPSQYVGDVSYSLYLWHWPVLVLLVSVIPSGDWRYYATALLVTAVLSVASYHLLEDPIRRSTWLTPVGGGARGRRWLPTGRRPYVAGGVAAVLLVASGVLATGAASPSRPADLQAAPTADGRPSAVLPACLGAEAMAEADACSGSTLSGVWPSPDHISEDTAGAYDCYTLAKAELRSCTFGSEDDDAVRLALVGDSHAASLLPGLQAQLAARNWRLDVFVGNGCQWRENTGPNCSTSMQTIRGRLASGGYEAVLTTARRSQVGNDPAAAPRDYAAAWRPLLAAGTRVIAIAEVSGVSSEALACVTRIGFSPDESDCATSRRDALSVADPLLEAARLAPGTSVVDLTALFCSDRECPSVIGNAIVYRDTAGHLTGTYSATVGPYLADAIAADLV